MQYTSSLCIMCRFYSVPTVPLISLQPRIVSSKINIVKLILYSILKHKTQLLLLYKITPYCRIICPICIGLIYLISECYELGNILFHHYVPVTIQCRVVTIILKLFNVSEHFFFFFLIKYIQKRIGVLIQGEHHYYNTSFKVYNIIGCIPCLSSAYSRIVYYLLIYYASSVQ